MRKLTEAELEQVSITLDSVGWKAFLEFIQDRKETLLDLDVPSDISELIEREQTFGRLNELKHLVPDFVSEIKQQNRHE